MAFRPSAADGSSGTKLRRDEPFRFQPVERRIDRARGDFAAKTILDLLQDGAAIALFPQLRLRTQQGEQNRLFEDAKVFSQFVCIVDKKGGGEQGGRGGEQGGR